MPIMRGTSFIAATSRAILISSMILRKGKKIKARKHISMGSRRLYAGYNFVFKSDVLSWIFVVNHQW